MNRQEGKELEILMDEFEIAVLTLDRNVIERQKQKLHDWITDLVDLYYEDGSIDGRMGY